MKVLKGLLLFIVLSVVAAVGVGLALPSRVHVERSILIEAPAATVFTVLNGYKQFGRWSPWATLDPAAAVTVEGPPAGVGARYTWSSSNPHVGSGSQELVESIPYRLIRARVNFGGFDYETYASYTLSPEGSATRLVWGYDSEFGLDISARWFGLMMDRMLGPTYEQGLTRLKGLVESLPRADFADLEVELTEVAAQPIAYVSGTSRTDTAAISKAYAEAFGSIVAALGSARVVQAGPVLAIGRSWDAKARRYAFDAAIPVPVGTQLPRGEVKLGQTYAGPVLRAVHKGPYSGLVPHFEKLTAYKAASGFEGNGDAWDVYVSDPGKTPAAELITESYVPVK